MKIKWDMTIKNSDLNGIWNITKITQKIPALMKNKGTNQQLQESKDFALLNVTDLHSKNQTRN